VTTRCALPPIVWITRRKTKCGLHFPLIHPNMPSQATVHRRRRPSMTRCGSNIE
jgi:hypothetical protein